MTEMRVGHGFDIHPFSEDPNRSMILGGVVFDGPGLEGHSDADAVAHACIDALLGATGLGDIGERYPDTDEKFLEANSLALLSDTAKAVTEASWKIANIDCTVILENPKLSPHREKMENLLSETVGAPVTVKGRRPEKLGTLGREEGIVCFAVALVSR
ncbi:MAG TPA: 2-C-methyl-D-erythritol 2,4-cyclodiphosphate synthase [Acidimicrobiales bacterium]|nr:2-C-methyl-D-erythritol 2,4-cyclodiphosphate synthase [Acidimicrobiales bacterium]|tara:strand:- start:1725 stop:2198 length:474 start_codon:yes stop_codon:yes gene_type:complete